MSGIKVFEYSHGWGTITRTDEDGVEVEFDNGTIEVFTPDGQRDPAGPVVLSLVPYHINVPV